MALGIIMMENIILENGRPADAEGRLEKEMRCYDLLDSLGIEYLRADHPVAETMTACEEIDRTLGVIEDCAFAWCGHLTDVRLPEGACVISASAFTEKCLVTLSRSAARRQGDR